MITLTTPRFLRRRARTGLRHRLADQPPHRGWEGREHELPLLAGHDYQTSQPIRGKAAHELMTDCPLDQCDWPYGQYYDDTDQHARLLEHLRDHSEQDTINTVYRLRRSVTKLQERD